MSSISIRVKRHKKTILEDLKSAGFTQINVLLFCYEKSIAVIHQNFGIKDSTDLVVSNENDAKIIIEVLKKNDLYLLHHVIKNEATEEFIKKESLCCSHSR